jgi:pyruvate/2-oxoglutarate dehydrogenase complex dihydrolipoamide dehydrogenase (E3) component
MVHKKDIIVLGGGVGGLVFTSVAAQLGRRVLLVEKNSKLGGDCLHTGCVPSKTLIRSAKVAHMIRQAKQFGLDATLGEVDLAAVHQRVSSVIDHIQHHDSPERFRKMGAEVIFGEARFIDAHTIKIKDDIYRAKFFVVATGSHAFIPPIDGIEKVDYLTNENIFKLSELPKRLAILGAGPIGFEMAQAYRRLGAEVDVIEMLPNSLPAIDRDTAMMLENVLSDEGVRFHFDAKVMSVRQQGDDKVIQYQQGGTDKTLTADALLVATGRAPNVDDFDLDKTGVKYSPRGIEVDKRLRTNIKHIFAVGDVIAHPLKFTHRAEYHAGIAIANILFRVPKRVDDKAFPTVVYCDPELASVGMTQAQAEAQGLKVSVETFPVSDIDRAQTDGAPTGQIKIIIHRNRLIGATICATHAGELIAELTLAIQNKMTLRQISDTVHAYPSLAQINRRVVNQYFGRSLFSDKVKRLVAWLRRW